MAAAVPGPVGEFCAALGRLVRACGVPQTEIAAMLGRSAGAVSALLSGDRRRAPEWDDVRRIVSLCGERHGSRGPLPVGLRLDVEWWRGRYGELEGAVESARGHVRRPATAAPAGPQTSVVTPILDGLVDLDVVDCTHMGIDEAVRLLAGGRPGLADAADTLLNPLCGGIGSPRIVGTLLDGFPERVRAAHGLPRGALLQAARVVLVAATLVRCGVHRVSRDQAALLVAELANGAARAHVWAGPDARPADLPLLDGVRTTMPDAVQQPLIDHYVHLATPLAAACPEFALSAGLPLDTGSGPKDSGGTGLAGLGALLARFAGRPGPAGAGRTRLTDPIAELDPRGPRLPSLADGYVNPRFRLAGPLLGESAEGGIASDKWWEEQPAYDAIERFLAAYLLSLPALRTPLVVLGHPGAGKSLLTTLLAARLRAGEFRPLRVELRHTPAEADLQAQLEHALRRETGRAVGWPDWSEAVPEAIPVVLLDGLDELLQAGAQLLDSARQWSYLREIERFQAREAEQGRPLIVLVTSRTVVADRSEIPARSQVLRLEPFGESEIERWLDIWNSANRSYFERHGLHPLALAPVLQHAELAAQPLLLLMLALYDSVSGDLHRMRYEPISRTQLYERLLTEFARRQVVKDGPLPVAEQGAAVDRELHRLSVIALGMLHRGTQAISGEQADRDLRALATEEPHGEPRGAEPLFGRFFFVHEAQAVMAEQRLRSYEFLHATFGEHLAARLIDRALRRLAESGAADDGELYAVLSFTPLTDRAQLVKNLGDMLAAWPTGRDRLPTLLAALFKAAEWDPHRSDPGHAPAAATRTYRNAVYEANLLLVAVLAGGDVYASAFVGSEHLVDNWRRHALLWKSQLSSESWELLSSTLHATRCWRDAQPDLLIGTRQAGRPDELVRQLNVFDMTFDSWHSVPKEGSRSDIADVVRRVMFVGDRDAELLLEATHPLLHQIPGALRSYETDTHGHARSAAQSLVALLSGCWYSPDELADLYTRCLRHQRQLPISARFVYLEAVVDRLRHDAEDLTDEVLPAVVRELCHSIDRADLLTAAVERSLLDFVHAVLGRGGREVADGLGALQKIVSALRTSDDPTSLLLRLTRTGRSSGTWQEAFPLPHGEAAERRFDGILSELDLKTVGARHPSAVIDLLRLAADLGLDDWLARHTARLLAALPAEAFALLRPTDLPHLRAALPNGAYADEFTTLERTWRG